jgi:hypothetical protein
MSKTVRISVPKVYGGAGTAVIAQTLLSIINAQSEGEALTRFIKMLYVLPPELRRRALAAMNRTDLPEHVVKEIEEAVRNYDMSEYEAEYRLKEERALVKLQAGLEAIGEFLFYILFIHGGEELVEKRVKAKQQ